MQLKFINFKNLKKLFLLILIVILTILLTAFLLVLSPNNCLNIINKCNKPVFVSIKPDLSNLPELQKFQACDGDWLSYREYLSQSDNSVIMLHGSTGQGEYFNEFAKYLSENNIATVYTLNIRGHYLSGKHKGDCEYIGQLEDDIVDLINIIKNNKLKNNNPENLHNNFAQYNQDNIGINNKNIYLLGHSLGGGLAIRFAGSKYNNLIKGYILLAPAILNSKILKNNNANGWAQVNKLRHIGLFIFNLFGITGLNSLPIVDFNKSHLNWSGKETLTYSYRLSVSSLPRLFYKKDIKSLKNKFILLVGAQDEANNSDKYLSCMPEYKDNIKILENTKHIDIVQNKVMFELVKEFIV